MTHVPEVLADLQTSPTPYHAVATARAVLVEAGFTEVTPTERFPGEPGRYLIARGGFLTAWIRPGAPVDGYRVVGAHTDSPNLRVKSRPDVTSAGVRQVGVEIYGGPLLSSWLDRDLGLAGRVAVRTADGITELLVREERPVLRIPQLAIHLSRDRTVGGEQELRLNAQQHLTPLWALGTAVEGDLVRHVAGLLDVEADAVLAWDLMAYDTQPPALVGLDGDLIASARLDDQLSCFCGAHALAAVATGDRVPAQVPVLCLYDHEEVGSSSATGAAGVALGDVLERISASAGLDRADHLAALARSLVISADGAHATHPNYADRHEPAHPIAIDGGIVIKRNASQRYATDAGGEAFVRAVAADAGVPLQNYVHRNDLPCGSTIGPLTAARLGVPTVDLGIAQWAMHSVRETAGTADVDHLITLLTAAWTAG